MTVNLESYTVEELLSLQDQAQKEIAAREAMKRQDLIDQIVASGVPLPEVIDALEKKLERKKIVSSSKVYRHPDDSLLEWRGKGRKPLWVTELLESGRELVLVSE